MENDGCALLAPKARLPMHNLTRAPWQQMLAVSDRIPPNVSAMSTQ